MYTSMTKFLIVPVMVLALVSQVIIPLQAQEVQVFENPLNNSTSFVDGLDTNMSIESLFATDIGWLESLENISDSEELIQMVSSLAPNPWDQKVIQNVKKLATTYIKWLEPYDKNWTRKSPKLLGSPIPYYTDDESEPLVYEWKVSCRNIRDCGSVMIATLDGESRIMEASTYGFANYERLGKWKYNNSNKLYYYSPFDQYIESREIEKIHNGVNILSESTSVEMIDPKRQQELSVSDKQTELTQKKDQSKKARRSGKIKFDEDMSIWFTQINEDQKNTLLSGMTIDVQHMSPTANCQSAVPCYDQFTGNYGCASGCSPTAMAIIFGYYDRMNIFPNLIGNSSVYASDWFVDTTTKSMVDSIRGYMGTYCSAYEWATTASNIRLWMQYARDRGYNNSQNGTYSKGLPSILFPKIRTEINAARPLIATFSSSTQAHSVVVYGYSELSPINTSQLHINYGWGNGMSDRYVSAYNPLSAADQLLNYKLVDITTVPVKF